MNIIPIENLYDYDYNIQVINSLKQYWQENDFFSCIGRPKMCCMLIYFSGCDVVYTTKHNKTKYAKSGDLVYVPIDSEYRVDLYNFKDEHAYSIGINLFFSDKNNEAFILSKDITIFSGWGARYDLSISEIDMYGKGVSPSFSGMKHGIFYILTKLSENYRFKTFENPKFNIIKNAIKYLETDERLLLSVKELANLCNISEVYFRRLFKEYYGLSPSKFKMNKKLSRALLLLKYENMSIEEISSTLGFNDSAYFIKSFKEVYKVTPLQYRNNIKNTGAMPNILKDTK